MKHQDAIPPAPRAQEEGAGQDAVPVPECWRAWQPAEVAALLAGIDVPWYVASGWAIDLFLGGQRRDHEDLEIGVPHARFAELAGVLAPFDLYVPAGGVVRLLASDPALLDMHHQTWVRERSTGLWRMDVFREPSRSGLWVCRRDDRISLPYAELIEHTEDGIPYARPEVVLLFKAKSARPKDEDDFEAVLPRLDASRRARLADWIALVHGEHPWLARLGATR